MGIGDDLPKECYSELNGHLVIQLFTSNDHINRPQLERVFNCENYKLFNHLSHVTALILKFFHLLLQKIGWISELINSNTLEGRPYQGVLPPSPLPDGVSCEQLRPFQFTGVDFAGPFYLKPLPKGKDSRHGCVCTLVQSLDLFILTWYLISVH